MTLLEAVKQHYADNDNFLDEMKTVSNHGADYGISNFTYYSDTAEFTDKHKKLIIKELIEYKEYCDCLDQSLAADMVSWRCVKDSEITLNEIDGYLYGFDIDLEVKSVLDNALAWWSVEHVAHQLEE